jgi:hypothetical protein
VKEEGARRGGHGNSLVVYGINKSIFILFNSSGEGAH